MEGKCLWVCLILTKVHVFTLMLGLPKNAGNTRERGRQLARNPHSWLDLYLNYMFLHSSIYSQIFIEVSFANKEILSKEFKIKLTIDV